MKLSIACSWLIASLTLPALAAEEGDPLDLTTLLQPEVALATKRSQKIWEAPAVIDVISRQDIQRRGYRHVADALRFLPGFYVVDDLIAPSVQLRGITNGQRAWSRTLKVMIDGQPVPFRPEASHWTGLELLPIYLVERIEVIRGPGSALYGADAFLGVVNVVTRRAEAIAGGYLTGSSGWNGRHPLWSGQVVLGYPTPWESELVAAAQWSQLDRSGLSPAPTSPALATLSDTVTQNDLSQPLTGFFRASLLKTQVGQFQLDGLWQRQDSSGEFFDARPFTHTTRLALDNGFVRAGWRQAWTPGLVSQLAISHTQAHALPQDQISLGRDDYQVLRRLDATSWDLAADTFYLWNDRDFVSLGADVSLSQQTLPTYLRAYSDQSLRGGELELIGEPGDGHHFLNLGVFGQSVVHPWDDTSLTLGLRHDAHSVYGSQWTARAAIVNQWNDWLSGKLLYGSSFKAPSPQQLFGRPLIYGDILGEPQLRPERAQTVETSLDARPWRGWSLHANGYLTHVTDAIRFINQSGNPKATNQGQILGAGLETAVRFDAGDWLMEANLAYQKTWLVEDPEAFPPLTANLGLGAPLDPLPFSVYGELRFTSSLPSTQSNFAANGHEAYAIPAQAIADITLASRDLALLGGETYVTLKVDNLLDTPYAYPGYGGLDYPGRRRHLWLSITQGF